MTSHDVKSKVKSKKLKLWNAVVSLFSVENRKGGWVTSLILHFASFGFAQDRL